MLVFEYLTQQWMTYFRHASLFVAQDRRTLGSMPTVWPRNASPTVLSGRIWQPVNVASGSPTTAAMAAAAKMARQSWYDQRRVYRKLCNHKCKSFSRTNSHQPPVHVICGLLWTGCWVVDTAPVMASLLIIYPPFALKRWNESDRV